LNRRALRYESAASAGIAPARVHSVTVEPEGSFGSHVKVSGARLRLEHVIEPSEEGSRITIEPLWMGRVAFPHTSMVRERSTGPPDAVDRLSAAFAGADGCDSSF
jgi:hypothetical protein